MPEPELFLLFVRPLNRAGIRYFVTGSAAAIFYGEPRLTHDVDLVVFLTTNDAARLSSIFPRRRFGQTRSRYSSHFGHVRSAIGSDCVKRLDSQAGSDRAVANRRWMKKSVVFLPTG
jgi:hypothetical protein